MVVIRLSRGVEKKILFTVLSSLIQRNLEMENFLRKLGYFNPSTKDKNKRSFFINSERLKHWESKGAQSSPTVKRLLKNYQNS